MIFGGVLDVDFYSWAAVCACSSPDTAARDPASAPAQLAPGGSALAALLALVAACGVCDGLASGALYGEAAVLAPRYTQALAAGNSVSGGWARRVALPP